MDTIIFATGNKNKMIEIRMILADLGCRILSQKEAGIQADVVEDGQTFEENALIKATTIADIARKMPEYKNAVVLADDSGLEIDALNKLAESKFDTDLMEATYRLKESELKNVNVFTGYCDFLVLTRRIEYLKDRLHSNFFNMTPLQKEDLLQ